MKDDRKEWGRRGEEQAAEYLRSKGYRILYRNYRTRTGEIDIIAESEGVIVFVEVRSKRSTRFGRGAESVDFRKQNRVRQAALFFLSQKGLLDRRIRFDVIDVFFAPAPQILHLESAF